MATSIALNASKSVSIPAGSMLYVTGQGIVTYDNTFVIRGPRAIQGQTTIGPFDRVVTVSLNATNTALSYYSTQGPINSRGNLVITGGPDSGSLVTDSLQVLANSGVAPVRRSILETRAKSGNATAGAVTNYTHHHTIALRGKFTRMRFALYGLETTTTAMAGAKVAAFSSANNDPAIWNAATWSTVTFGGSATWNNPARIAANRPAVIWSDWIDVPAVDRTDGGVGFLIGIRTLDGAQPYSYVSHEPRAADANIRYEVGALGVSTDMVWRVYRQTGDNGLTTISAFTNSAFDVDTSMVAAVQTMTADGVLTVGAFGDSIANGQRIDVRQNRSWSLQAVKELTAETGLNVQNCNLGRPGRVQADFLDTAVRLLPELKLHAASFPVYSPNDPLATQAQVETYWSNTMQFVDACNSAGTVPIVVTAIPVESANAASNALRQQLNNRARAQAAARTFRLIDADAYLGVDNADGTSSFISGYASAQPPHPSDTGYAAYVIPAKLGIRSALGI